MPLVAFHLVDHPAGVLVGVLVPAFAVEPLDLPVAAVHQQVQLVSVVLVAALALPDLEPYFHQAAYSSGVVPAAEEGVHSGVDRLEGVHFDPLGLVAPYLAHPLAFQDLALVD